MLAQAAFALVWASFVLAAEPECAACHAEIAARFARTGMGRSVAPVGSPGNRADWAPAQPFVHDRSRRTFEPRLEDGKYVLRRFQTGPDGSRENEIEREAHWAVGSGEHAQTFLHRAEQGAWIELPLSWYAESGGAWAMSPGYDQPHHAGFRRALDDRCLFCHAAYPSPGEPDALRPIDCARCHGPGDGHAAAMRDPQGAAAGGAQDLVNPARLDPDRSLEICLQCHLQSTSRPLPDQVRRFDREPFSFRPGEPLGAFAIAFDHPEGTPQKQKFEVNGAGYGLLRSACFGASGAAALSCRTCHDPHGEEAPDAVSRRATAACRSCHAEELAERAHSGDCLSCHMPRRRTEDAVHVAMHDHGIPRLAPEADWRQPIDELEAARAAAYQGDVALLYPPELAEPERSLYLAVAQVREGTNPAAGLARFQAAVRARPAPAGALFELAEAYRRSGDCAAAAGAYREALDGGLDSAGAAQFLGECLLRLGWTEEAVAAMDEALERHPRQAGLLMTAAVAAGQAGAVERSIGLLERAVAAEPERPLAWLNLGASLERAERTEEAERAYRQAVAAQPDHAYARTHLAALLVATGRVAEAERQLEEAVAVEPRFAPARLQLGHLLAERGEAERARRVWEEAVRWGSPAVRQEAERALEALRR